MTARRTILDAIADHRIFGPWFSDRASWEPWFAFLSALFGLPMTPDQVAIYQVCTGRSQLPLSAAAEAWLVCGRRAGKSFVLALVAVFLACFRDYRAHLAPGERAMVLVIATDRRQARTIMNYTRAFLTLIPSLKKKIMRGRDGKLREREDGFDLDNAVTIEVATASFRTVRGYTLAAVLADELAFWPTDDAAEPDYAIIDAIRPGMATIPGAMLLCASSPYARRGALWDAHRQHFGKDGDPILVWQAASRVMNPTIPQAIVDRAYERDPASAAAEWGAQFRTDVERLFTREAIEAVVASGVRERQPLSNVAYEAFCDPSGGVSDAMTLAIAHQEGGKAVIDCLREHRPPFSPDAVVKDFAETLKSYRVSTVRGDRYAGEWPRERFQKHGINYLASDRPKSDLYRDLLPAVNSSLVDLLDNERLTTQMVGLERRTSRGGRDSIDHGPGAHDDLANVVAGVVRFALVRVQEHWSGGGAVVFRDGVIVSDARPGGARATPEDPNSDLQSRGKGTYGGQRVH